MSYSFCGTAECTLAKHSQFHQNPALLSDPLILVLEPPSRQSGTVKTPRESTPIATRPRGIQNGTPKNVERERESEQFGVLKSVPQERQKDFVKSSLAAVGL